MFLSINKCYEYCGHFGFANVGNKISSVDMKWSERKIGGFNVAICWWFMDHYFRQIFYGRKIMIVNKLFEIS